MTKEELLAAVSLELIEPSFHIVDDAFGQVAYLKYWKDRGKTAYAYTCSVTVSTYQKRKSEEELIDLVTEKWIAMALDGRYILDVKFVKGHRGKGRYRAALKWNGFPPYLLIGNYMHAFAKTPERAVTKLAETYANY